MFDLTYEKAVSVAAELKQIGNTDVYLSRESTKPWNLVTKVKPGGFHRLDMSTSVSFVAECPQTGLIFRWVFEIEDISVNGKGHYEIKTQECHEVLKKISAAGRKDFISYLKDCAKTVREQGEKYRAVMERQFRDAQTLEEISKETT